MTYPWLSQKESCILRLLIEDGESSGVALIAASNGELKKGTIYTTLQRMEDKQLVTKTASGKWKNTAKGAATLKALDGAARKVG